MAGQCHALMQMLVWHKDAGGLKEVNCCHQLGDIMRTSQRTLVETSAQQKEGTFHGVTPGHHQENRFTIMRHREGRRWRGQRETQATLQRTKDTCWIYPTELVMGPKWSVRTEPDGGQFIHPLPHSWIKGLREMMGMRGGAQEIVQQERLTNT